jgi:hypothetical protein
MGSIKSLPVRSFLGTLLCLLPLCLLPAQSPGSRPLAGEIEDIGKKLKDSSVSGRERREALIRLARLRALSGDREGAAAFWIEAAFAEPGYRDDASLLEGTRCLIALGEFERAGANITTILQTGQDGELKTRALCLGAELEAFRKGDTGTLSVLSEDPEYGERRAALLYTLWKTSGDESYRIRLEADYPLSPEGRIAGGTGGVSGPSTALWVLMAGREGMGFEEPAPPPRSPDPVMAASAAAAAAEAPPPESPAAEGPAALQTGLFSREENARAMAERLRTAGFAPAISRRGINGNGYWAVQVEPGRDLNATILALKHAGFESFPVY